MHIILFKKRKKKKSIYKNRAYKYCTANCLYKYSAAEFLVLQTSSVNVHKHNQCFKGGGEGDVFGQFF